MAKQQSFGDKVKKQSVERVEFVPQLGKKAKLTPVRFVNLTKSGSTYRFEDRIARLAEPEGGGDSVVI